MQAKSRDVNFVSKIKCYELIFSINKAVFIICYTVVQLYNFAIFQCNVVSQAKFNFSYLFKKYVSLSLSQGIAYYVLY